MLRANQFLVFHQSVLSLSIDKAGRRLFGSAQSLIATVPSRTTMPSRFLPWLVGILCLAGHALFADEREDAWSGKGKLVLTSGEVISGTVATSEDGSVIRWLGEGFFDPFAFRTRTVQAINFDHPVPPQLARSTVDPEQPKLIFEMRNGDEIAGDLLNWDKELISIRHPVTGELRFKADQLIWLHRYLPLEQPSGDAQATKADAALAISQWGHLDDPLANGANRWTLSEQSAWKRQGTAIATDQIGSRLTCGGVVPQRLLIDVSLAWTRTPDFVLSATTGVVGQAGGLVKTATDQSDLNRGALSNASRLDGWRLECAGTQLVLVASFGEYVDLTELVSLDDRNSLRLLLYLDLLGGSIEVMSADGDRLGMLEVPASVLSPAIESPVKPDRVDAKPQPHRTVITIENLSESFRIEKLRLSQWKAGIASSSGVSSQSHETSLLFNRGELLHGSVVGFDPLQQRLRIRTQSGDESFHSIEDFLEARRRPIASEQKMGPTIFSLSDGSSLSGEIVEMQSDWWLIKSSGTEGKVKLPLRSLRSVVNLAAESKDVQEIPVLGRIGRLSTETVEIAGRLVQMKPEPNSESGEDPAAYPLGWHPIKSLAPARILSDFSGRIQFRDQATQNQSDSSEALLEQQRLRNQRLKRGLNFGELFLQRTDRSKAASVRRYSHLLHFRSGDVLKCQLKSIDDQHLTVSCEDQDERKVSNQLVKAIEFVSNSPPPSLEVAKKQRLLTIPRLQKSEPPSHLLCSHNGDFLRCRLVEMENDFLTVQIQSEQVKIPRERLAQIIWFHPDEGSDQGTSSTDLNAFLADQPGDPLRLEGKDGQSLNKEAVSAGERYFSGYEGQVQVVLNNGKRTTFLPESLKDDWISGDSRWEGACEFDLGRADELIFGRAIASAVTDFGYNQWRFQSATEPLVSAVLGSQSGTDSSRSAVLGDQLPQLILQSLDGSPLRLSDFRGSWLVLDFWTTWSAASAEARPELEKILTAVAEYDVRSLSVSVGESRATVSGYLERHPTSMPVATDMDGELAERLGVRVLPEVVLVEPSGKVVSVHSGGGEAMISDILQDLVSRLEALDGAEPQEIPAAPERD